MTDYFTCFCPFLHPCAFAIITVRSFSVRLKHKSSNHFTGTVKPLYEDHHKSTTIVIPNNWHLTYCRCLSIQVRSAVRICARLQSYELGRRQTTGGRRRPNVGLQPHLTMEEDEYSHGNIIWKCSLSFLLE